MAPPLAGLPTTPEVSVAMIETAFVSALNYRITGAVTSLCMLGSESAELLSQQTTVYSTSGVFHDKCP